MPGIVRPLLRSWENTLKSVVTQTILVGGGGFFGAIMRYALSGLVQRHASLVAFPFGTLSVNLLGCLLIGLFVGFADSRQFFSPEMRTFALIGVLGAFTTFSTFGYETFALARDHEYLRALWNIGIHVVLGLALVWVGYSITNSR